MPEIKNGNYLNNFTRYAVYSVSNADTNPRQEWLDMGSPDCPTRSQEITIR